MNRTHSSNSAMLSSLPAPVIFALRPILIRVLGALASLFLFGANASALELEITSSSNPVEDGAALTVTMTVSNSGNATLSNVVLQAVTPEFMSIQVASQTAPTGACAASTCYAGDTITWALGDLAPGEVRIIRYSDALSTSANEGDVLIAAASVTVDGSAPLESSHSVRVTELAPPLLVAIAADRNPAAPGDLVTYRIRYSNTSTTTTANSLTATIPSGMTFVSASGNGSLNGDTVSWPISVAPGINGTREFTASVNAGLNDGELLRTNAQFADTIGNSSATASEVLSVQANSPLDLMITGSTDPVEDGAVISITLTVSNPSATTVSNVVLQAVTPDFMSIQAAAQTTPFGSCYSSTCYTGDTITWALGSLAPGEVRVARFSDSISTAAGDGDLLVAQATVTADGVSAVQDKHTIVTTESAPPLRVAIASDKNPAAPGEVVTYRLRYSNSSFTVVANALTATIPDGMTFISASDGGTLSGSTVSWPVSVGPRINGAREFSATVNGGVNDGELLRSNAQFADSIGGSAATAAEVLAVQASSPLDLMISGSSDPVEDGTVINITMTVSNPGTTPLTNVVLRAITPDFLSIQSAAQTSPAGTCYSSTCYPGDSISWLLGNLGPGEIRVVRYSDSVSTTAGDGDLIVAEASVTADGVSVVQDKHTIITTESRPPLRVALAADRNPASQGELVKFRLRYSNSSSTVTANTLTATVPDGMNFVSASDGGSLSGRIVSWPISVLPYNNGTREFTAMVDGGLNNGELLRANALFADSIGGSGSTASEVLAVQSVSPLDLMINGSIDPIEDGSALTVTMTVSNPGDTALANVILRAITPDYLSIQAAAQTTPAGTCYASTCYPGDVITWALGSLAPGEIRVVRYSDEISTSAGDGDLLVAEASVTAFGVSEVQDSHTVITTESVPPLQVSLTADGNPAAPNDLIPYRIRFSNSSLTVTANTLTATIPDGMAFISATGGGSIAGNTVTWPVSIGPGIHGVREFTITPHIGLRDGELLRTEAVFADSIGGSTATSANILAVQDDSPFGLAIATSADPVEDGSQLTVTMTVSNRGGTTQANVILQAVTPDYMSVSPVTQTSPPGSCYSSTCYAGDTITWALGSLSPGEERVVSFTDSISTSASEGDLLIAEASVFATGVSPAQDSHSIVVSEDDVWEGFFLQWPVPGYEYDQITQGYAQYDSGSATKHHAGIDIGAPLGTPVVAAAAGTARVVLLANNNNRTHCLGNVVVIDHGSRATLYAHLQDNVTAVDGAIEAGQQIGFVGNSVGLQAPVDSDIACPSLTGPHLHFEAKQNDVLGTTSDNGEWWGYTPPGVGVGSPIPADHPESYLYLDPVIGLHAVVELPAPATVAVTALGGDVTLRAGPDSTYRSIGLTTVVGGQFIRIREFNIATPGCSGGWYQLQNTDGSYFADSISGGTIRDAWACRGNELQPWIVPVGPASGDTDGDGLPDSWEIQNGLNPNDASDAALDDDGDGLTNLEEYVFGTPVGDSDVDDDGVLDGSEWYRRTDPADSTSVAPPVIEEPEPAVIVEEAPSLAVRDTVVLTHGLSKKADIDNPNALWTGGGERQARTLISNRTNGQVNVIQYIWRDAFTDEPDIFGITYPKASEYNAAQEHVANAGARLAKFLQDELGPGYSGKIHFIGHSLGTAVNAYGAAYYLSVTPTVTQAQFTALDRPDRIFRPLVIKDCTRRFLFRQCVNYDENFFASIFYMLQTNPLSDLDLKIDNYYSPDLVDGFGVGDFTNGIDVYNYEEPGGLVEPNNVANVVFDYTEEGFPNNHSGVQQWYRWTISPQDPVDPSGENNPVCNGVNFTGGSDDPQKFDILDPSLYPCARGFAWSIVNDPADPETVPFPATMNLGVGADSSAIEIGEYRDYGCTLVPSDPNEIIIRCTNGGQAASPEPFGSTKAAPPNSAEKLFGIADLDIPDGTVWISFEYLFTGTGNGDYVAVFLDDTPIWSMSLSSVISDQYLSTGPLPIAGLTGNRKFTVALYGTGPDASEVSIRNIRYSEPLYDMDGDGVADDVDNCLNDANADQSDVDSDGAGDVCDGDIDGDGVANEVDDYPYGRFADAAPGHWAFPFIESLARSGITAGCGNGNYCPAAPVTRAQMAVFLERGMNGSSYSPPAPSGNVFFDVAAGDFAASFIEQLAADGITAGCGNGNYCPDDVVTRDQMAVFLLRAKYGAGHSPAAPSGAFGDVPPGHWAAAWIEELAAEGITAGCGNGNYCPDAEVTRDQMAVFLVRTFGL